MIEEVFSLLLDKRVQELSDKAGKDDLSKTEQAELRALSAHRDKAPAVAQRIRILTAKMAQPSRWGMFLLRFSKKFRQNLAELEALVQYGNSKAVWEIAYLLRKNASRKLTRMEKCELEYLITYHDCPDVVEMTHLKLKEQFGQLTLPEARKLTQLHRKPYQQDSAPDHVLDLFWDECSPPGLDLSGIAN
jgi:hypothetical protein